MIMRACHQLRLLLWKNFLVRKREKLRLLLEIVWPLMLFLILMWVRTRGLKENFRECQFDEKALPSAGVWPFIRTFLCTFSNPCHSAANPTWDPSFLNASRSDSIVMQLEEFLKDNVHSGELQSFKLVGQDISDFVDVVSNYVANEKSTLLGTVNLGSILNVPLATILKSYTNLTEDVVRDLRLSANGLKIVFLEDYNYTLQEIICKNDGGLSLNLFENLSEEMQNSLCSLSSSSFSSALDDALSAVNFSRLLDELSKLVEANTGHSLARDAWKSVWNLSLQLVNNISSIDEIKLLKNSFEDFIVRNLDSVQSDPLGTVYWHACGRNLSDFYDALFKHDKMSQLEDLTKRFNADDWLSSKDDAELNATSAGSCKMLLDVIPYEKIVQVVWRQLKPLLQGKILYAPNLPVTNRIMLKISEKFSIVSDVLVLTEEWLNNVSPGLQQYFVDSPVILKFMRDITDSERVAMDPLLSRLWTWTTPILNLKSNSTMFDFLLKLNKYFNSDVIERWHNLLNSIDRFVLMLQKALKCFDVNKVRPMSNEDEAIAEGLRLIADNELWAVVVFENVDQNDSLPAHVKYKIRMDADKVDSTKRVKDRLSTPGPRRRPFIDLKYLTFGFAYLQDMLEQAIIEEQTGVTSLPGIWVQQFPYPCYISDVFIIAISRTFPLFMVLSFVYTSSMLIKSIVYEKERRLKEIMKAMGLGNAVHWLAWFITSFLLMVTVVALLSLLLKYGNILELSDVSVVFLFLTLYSIATISKSFLISTFFSNANVSVAAGGILFFMLYLPYPFMILWEEELGGSQKAMASILSNVAFGFGCNYLARYEERGTGLHWQNLNESPFVDDTFSMAKVMLMLLLDATVYLLLTCYIENVFPGEYGVPKPWYFFLTRLYWFPRRAFSTRTSAVGSELLAFEMHAQRISSDAFEAEPVHLPCGIRIERLKKEYGNGKVAVDDLSLNFYENQITSFLGHNGAGKTTTISILTGIYTPTSGTARIYDRDIRSDMDLIRRTLGMCPQFNVLFDLLTVEEHLFFYGQLKGSLPANEGEQEVRKMIDDIGLLHKRKELSRHLSGGMQRKLSVAIAFVGGSRTVILDEPTAGVDPYARRNIWELLLKYKTGRTIILTTHHMDEADLLGDRIAIISNGRLCCCGSSLYLKKRFGSGYRLTLLRQSLADRAAVSVSDLSAFVESHVPGSRLVDSMGSELLYLLPSEAQNNAHFERLFSALDCHLHTLGLSTYGISDTTLEEIFLRMAGGSDSPAGDVELNSGIETQERERQTVIDEERNVTLDTDYAFSNGYLGSSALMLSMRHPANYICTTGWRLVLKHVWALHVKRFLHSKRNFKGIFCEVILPPIFVCVMLLFTMILPPYRLEPELQLQPWIYGPLNLVFFSNENPMDSSAVMYEQLFVGDPGIGTRCMHGNPLVGKPCVRELVPPVAYRESSRRVDHKAGDEIVHCSCESGAQQCPAGAGGPTPQPVRSVAGDFLLNMTLHNITDWLLKTNPEFSNRRYGGMTFGFRNPTATVNVSYWHWIFDKLSRATNLGQPLVEQSAYIFEEFERRLRAVPVFGNIKVWFNNRGWAAMVSYVNALNNLVLRAHLPDDRDPLEYGITATNHPLNFTRKQAREELIKRSGVSLMHAICTIFAMSFVPASFVLYLIEDRVSKSQHLQFITGVQPALYWISNFAWDLVVYLISALCCVVIFLCFNAEAYVSSSNFPGLVLLLILYGWSCTPLMYPFSLYIDVSSTAFVVLTSVNLFIGVVTTVSSFILELMDDSDLQQIADVLKKAYLVFPHYCFGRGLLDMATNHLIVTSLEQFDVTVERNPLTWEFLGRNLLAMFAQGIVFFTFNLLLQYNVLSFLRFERISTSESLSMVGEGEDDDDVAAERRRVLSTEEPDSVVLKVVNLTKVYRNWRQRLLPNNCRECSRMTSVQKWPTVEADSDVRQSLLAVDRLCFSVSAGECFGLLGVNGAGKTTTFKMLTRDTAITGGDAFINGHSIQKNMDRARACIGYCPQFDALDCLLTGEEHLEFYCRLRGIPEKNLEEVVQWAVTKLNLDVHARHCAGEYSGGNKRKLSTAIALIGNPAIVFLDEPTTGMDPQARRFLWNCISDLVKDGRSVVLTSHSLEECEALCTRLAIMVNGRFQCLGSIQHLKSKFGEGYLLRIRVTEPSATDRIKKFVVESFPAAVLQEEHHNQVVYHLVTCKLSFLFKEIEAAKGKLQIEDYSVCQTTLDQVFIHFAKRQRNILIDN